METYKCKCNTILQTNDSFAINLSDLNCCLCNSNFKLIAEPHQFNNKNDETFFFSTNPVDDSAIVLKQKKKLKISLASNDI